MPTRRETYVNDDKRDNLLPRFIYSALKNHSTSLGNNKAFPIIGDVPFDYKLIKDAFSTIVTKSKNLGINSMSQNELETKLSRLVNDCKREEKPIRDFLIKKCENMINETFSIPKESLLINYKLQDEVSTTKPMRVSQEDLGSFKFHDAEDAEAFSNEVDKRRVVNAIIQGAADNMSKMLLDQYGNEGQLYTLKAKYDDIIAINDYLLFTKKEEISEKNPMQGGYVEVHLGMDGNKTTIDAQGIIFPFLLRESIKGLFEAISAHGLPQDKKRAQAIIRRADFLLAEPWDMRFGPTLYGKLFSTIDELKMIPYMFMNLVSLDTDKFNKFMKDVLSDSESGEDAINWLYSISCEEEYDDSSLEKEPSVDDSRGVINDETLHDDENSYLTCEELNELDPSEDCDPSSLADADVKDIFFEFEDFNGMLYATILLGNCKFGKKEGISLMAEPKPRIGEKMFQLHISLDETLRQKGIATKLYQAFIQKCGDIVSLYSNRVGTYTKEQDKEIPLDASIDKIFKHLEELPNVSVEKVISNDGKDIGICATYKSENGDV